MKAAIRNNNFDIMRLLAAFFVLSGHMGHIMGLSRPILLGQEVQSLGAKILFLLGGYFVAKSWDSDRNLLHYWLKRISRLWPPLIAAVLFAALIVGPIFTELTVSEYFQHPQTWTYVVNNILFSPAYSLPGVFTTNIYPNAVNGSLWTMPVELLMYVLVPIISVVFLRKKNKLTFVLMSIFTALVCAFQIVHLVYFPSASLVVYGSDIFQMFDLMPFYFIGMLMTFPEFKKLANLPLAAFLFVVCCCLNFGLVMNYVMLYLVLPYFIFSFGWSELTCFGKKTVSGKFEISYGLYLYGFIVQQSLVAISLKYSVSFTFAEALIISTVVTAILAFASHLFIELPIINVVGKLVKREKTGNVNNG